MINKNGFYYYEILDLHSIVYVYDKTETSFLIKGIITFDRYSDKIEIENEIGTESYIMKDSSSIRHYKYFSNKEFDNYKNVVIQFIFEVL
jgi:hypothetical protein